MTRLLHSLFQIAMLRKDPGILPASTSLVLLLALAYVGMSALQALANGDDRIVTRAVLDIGLTVAFFWIVLALTRRSHRIAQTLSAVFGTSVLLAPLVMLLILAGRAGNKGDPLSVLTTVGSTLVFVWFLLIMAHVLRSALDTGLVTGFAAALAWVLASWMLAARLFAAAG